LIQQYQRTFSDTGKISPRENQYQQYQRTFSDTGKISPRENQYQQYQRTFSDTVKISPLIIFNGNVFDVTLTDN
jgi:ribosomal protein S18